MNQDMKLAILLCVALLAGICTMLFVSLAYADGMEFDTILTPSVMAVCAHANTREDGSLFAVEDRGNVDLYITQTPGADAEPYYSGPDCASIVVLSAMPAGQYYRHWRQWDKGGLVSKNSDVTPFYLWTPSAPMPPTDSGFK